MRGRWPKQAGGPGEGPPGHRPVCALSLLSPLKPLEAGHELVAVAPVDRAHPLHRFAAAVHRMTGQHEHRQPHIGAEQARLARGGERGLDGLLRLGETDVVHLGERGVERGVLHQRTAQRRKAFGRKVRGLDRHRLPAGEPQPLDAQHPAARRDVQQPGEGVVRRDVADVQELGRRLQALGAHVLGVRGELERLGDLRLGDEGALALDAFEAALDDQFLQGLAHGRARGVELGGQSAFGRHGGARRHGVGHVEEVPLEPVVLRHARCARATPVSLPVLPPSALMARLPDACVTAVTGSSVCRGSHGGTVRSRVVALP